MALEQEELVTRSGSNIFADFPQVSMNDHITAIFGASAGAETLVRCAPVGYNDTTGFYGAWIAPDPATLVVDLTSATAGTFTVTADGVVTGNIAFDATAAAVEAALLAVGYVVSVTLATQVYTIVFDAAPQVAVVPVLTGDVTSITGGTPTATPAAGTSTYGLSTIVGFVWPDEVSLSATLQVHGEVMIKGRIAYSYIEAAVDAGDVTSLATELKNNALSRGLIVEDLPNIH